MFDTSINSTSMKTLFDTFATKSVMSGKMYRELRLAPLDTTSLPSVVGANGSSLGVLGRIRCNIDIGKEDSFDQTFLVCENLKRGVILGKDFTKRNCAGVYWTPKNTRVLHTIFKVITEMKELLPKTKAAVHVKQTTKLPPRSCAVIDVNINTTSTDKIRMIPDSPCQSRHSNLLMYTLDADLSKRKKDMVTPFVLINLSSTHNLRLKKNTVVAFAEKDETEGKVVYLESINITPQHWVPKQTGQTFAQIAQIDADADIDTSTETKQFDADIDLHIFTSATNFIKSPAEVDTHRKVDLEDKVIKEETREKFHKLCDRYDDIISKGSGDIGKMLLMEMDIDTGDSPPIAPDPTHSP